MSRGADDSSVDQVVGPGDVAGGVGEQESDESGHFGRFGESTGAHAYRSREPSQSPMGPSTALTQSPAASNNSHAMLSGSRKDSTADPSGVTWTPPLVTPSLTRTASTRSSS